MRHVIQPLLRHRMMPLLVVAQVALACAIACNALFMLQQKLKPILTADGVGDPSHLIVAWQIVASGKPWQTSRLRETETALRAIPGVASVSVAGALPMVTQAQFNSTVRTNTGGAGVSTAFYVGDNLVDTLGLKLVAGRDFSRETQDQHNDSVGFHVSGPGIITQALADRLFPDGHALGHVVHLGSSDNAGSRTIIGVVAHLMRNDFGDGNHLNIDCTMLLPGIPGKWPIPSIGVRVAEGGNVQAVLKQVKRTIQTRLGDKMVKGIPPVYDTYRQLRRRALAASRAAVWLLAGVTLVVLIVTLAGIMGMTAYWVQQRTRQIGIRRALGARQADILRYLQLENLLVVGTGVVLGLASTYLVNLWLMRHFELSRLPWAYLPIGALLLLALGQLAVLGPALRASRVPPVVATRSA